MTMLLAPPGLRVPRGRGLVLPQPTVPIVLSGNEQTPYTRRFGREGDGLNANDPLGKYSIGVWEATQNKVTQSIPGGAATTNVTKAGDAGATLTLVADADRPFPNASATVWELDNSAGSTDATVDFAGNTGNTNKHSVSIYAKKSAGTPTLSLEGAGGVNITQTSWDRSKAENLTPGGTTENLRVTCPAGAVVRFVAAQLEEQPLATPFTLSNGSAASRSASSDRIPARLANASQMWFALLLQMPWGATADIHGGLAPRFLAWQVDSNNRILITYATASDVFQVTSTNAGSSDTVISATQTFVAGDLKLIIMRLTAANQSIAIDDGAFVTPVARAAGVPDLSAATQIYIGSDPTPANHVDATILFKAVGRGPLTDRNGAALNHIARNNRIDSRPEDLPGGCTFKWPPADGDISRMLVAA